MSMLGRIRISRSLPRLGAPIRAFSSRDAQGIFRRFTPTQLDWVGVTELPGATVIVAPFAQFHHPSSLWDQDGFAELLQNIRNVEDEGFLLKQVRYAYPIPEFAEREAGALATTEAALENWDEDNVCEVEITEDEFRDIMEQEYEDFKEDPDISKRNEAEISQFMSEIRDAYGQDSADRLETYINARRTHPDHVFRLLHNSLYSSENRGTFLPHILHTLSDTYVHRMVEGLTDIPDTGRQDDVLLCVVEPLLVRKAMNYFASQPGCRALHFPKALVGDIPWTPPAVVGDYKSSMMEFDENPLFKSSFDSRPSKGFFSSLISLTRHTPLERIPILPPPSVLEYERIWREEVQPMNADNPPLES